MTKSLLVAGFSFFAINLVSSSLQAAELDVGLSDEVLSTELLVSINHNLNATVGYIYSEDEGQLLQSALLMSHDAGAHHFEFGAQYSRLWADNSPNGSLVGVGGRYSLAIGANVSFHASGYFAPSVLSFGDIDGYYEMDSQIQYNVNPNMGFYVGYRYIRFEYDHAKNSTFDDGLYLGAKFKF